MSLVWGPAPTGGYLRAVPSPDHTPRGPSIAPRVVAAIAWADARWELGIGALEPAPDLRPLDGSST